VIQPADFKSSAKSRSVRRVWFV